MKLDSHQHFWDYAANPDDFTWMTDEYSVLGRNFMPADLKPLLAECDISGCIAVQAREVVQETEFLLDLANKNTFIRGVVGWVDMRDEQIETVLESFTGNTLLKGFRMLIHDQADVDFAASAAHARGVGLLAAHGWTYDLLLRTIHLPSALRLVDQYPNQPFVVDHIAKPKLDGSDWTHWLTGMQSLAKRPNVMCKLSGMVTEANWAQWQAADYPRFLNEVLEAFGANRCMFGSDWPVSTCATDYSSVYALVNNWASALSATEQNAIFGATCAHFYHVEA